MLSGPAARPFLSFLTAFLFSCIVGASSDALLSVALVELSFRVKDSDLLQGNYIYIYKTRTSFDDSTVKLRAGANC